jgi:hypothetical protein
MMLIQPKQRAGTHMPKRKHKKTPAQKRARRERKKRYMMVFMNGKQVRVRRPPLIEGLTEEEFILRNADPIWLHQNEMWELIDRDRNPDQGATGGF